jgi:hypothetical protein
MDYTFQTIKNPCGDVETFNQCYDQAASHENTLYI